jgi:hypothetical protein
VGVNPNLAWVRQAVKLLLTHMWGLKEPEIDAQEYMADSYSSRICGG